MEKLSKPIKAVSFIDVLGKDVPATDCHVEKVHQEHLEYDEHGLVIKVVDPDFDLQALIQSYAADGDVVDNLKRLARGDISVNHVDPSTLFYGDISTAPDDPNGQIDWLADGAAPSSAPIKETPSADSSVSPDVGAGKDQCSSPSPDESAANTEVK